MLVLRYKIFHFKTPIDDSPMAEFDCWQKHEAEYKSIHEQLKSPFVVSILGKFKTV